MGRKRPTLPALVRARVQANVGDWRRGQIVEVRADDPLLGHYLQAVDPPPSEPSASAALLGVAPPEDGDSDEPG
jgi:hypothetical protein